MKNTVTKKKLDAACDVLNGLMGNPLKPYSADMQPQKGCIYVDYGTNGCHMVRMSNNGGVSAVIGYERKTKKEIHFAIEAMIWAIEKKNEGK